jgi:hypothetical protein
LIQIYILPKAILSPRLFLTNWPIITHQEYLEVQILLIILEFSLMHSIQPYMITISDAGQLEDNRLCKMGSIRGKSLGTILKEFIDSHTKNFFFEDRDGYKKAFKFSESEVAPGLVSGFISSGESGTDGEHIDTKTGIKTGDYGENDANTNKKFFYVEYSEDKESALLFMHRIHGRGIKTLFLRLLASHLSLTVPQLTVSITPLSFKKALNQWYNMAKVKEIRGIAYRESTETGDRFDTYKQKNKLEVICKPFIRGRNYGFYKDLDKGEAGKLVSFGVTPADEIKVRVSLGNKSKVLTVSSKSEPVCAIDFTKDDIGLKSGKITHKAMLAYCKSLSEDMQS